MFLKPLWILMALAAVAAVVAVVVSAVHRRRQKTKNRTRVNAACGSSPRARVPIFAMMVAQAGSPTSGPDRALAALVGMYARAACPLRIFAGVAEYYGSASAPTLAARFAKASDASTMAFKVNDHLRVLRAPIAEFPGTLTALEQVQRFLYRGEAYVLVIRPDTVLAQDWDTSLLAALSAAPHRSVVSMRPPPMGTPGTLGTFLGVASAQPPSFASFSIKAPVEGQLPAAIPALAWSSRLSFSEGPLPLGDAGALVSAMDDDVAMTSRLLLSGWVLQHPVERVGTKASSDADADADANRNPGATGTFLLPPSVQAHLGLSQAHNLVSVRGRLGLVPAPNPAHELAAKIGSSGDVLSMLARIDSRQKVQHRNLGLLVP